MYVVCSKCVWPARGALGACPRQFAGAGKPALEGCSRGCRGHEPNDFGLVQPAVSFHTASSLLLFLLPSPFLPTSSHPLSSTSFLPETCSYPSGTPSHLCIRGKRAATHPPLMVCQPGSSWFPTALLSAFCCCACCPSSNLHFPSSRSAPSQRLRIAG